MIGRLIKKEMTNRWAINVILLCLIMLSAILITSSVSMIQVLSGSMQHLFAATNAPDFVQMHSGAFEQSAIDFFTEHNPLVKQQQTVAMLTIAGSDLYLADQNQSESGSVMDASLVCQNQSFDFLINLNDQIVSVAPGEVAVPIYYMQQKNLIVGDQIWLKQGDFELSLTITDFIRDVQMNPALISSKRILVSQQDFDVVKANLGEIEYLVEYQLNQRSDLNTFVNQYQDAGLPGNGPVITWSLLKLFNGISDGITVAIVILTSILLIIIALLCLRFTLIAVIEEDYREIGVMKAIGLPSSAIKTLYLTKYLVLASVASVAGYALAFGLSNRLTEPITLSMGRHPRSGIDVMISLSGSILVVLIVWLFCQLVLRRFNKISAVTAISTGKKSELIKLPRRLTVTGSKIRDIPFLLGLRDVIVQFKSYLMLCWVFLISTFIIIVPLNVLETLKSPDMISYLGIGRCDLRIDMQKNKDIELRFQQMLVELKNDPNIERFSPLVTCNYSVLREDGRIENLSIETGDFTIFPLDYIAGHVPQDSDQIALSYLAAKELNKQIGDVISINLNGEIRALQICGIYQDITNGGKTAKAMIPTDLESILWYNVSIDVVPGADVEQVVQMLGNTFYPAKITAIDEYLTQTFVVMLAKLEISVVITIAVALIVITLITSLFYHMMLAKNAAELAICQAIGYSIKDCQRQYLSSAIICLLVGVVTGIISALTLGQSLVNLFGRTMGAAKLTFIGDPLRSYLLCPLGLFMVVVLTMKVVLNALVKNNSIRQNLE